MTLNGAARTAGLLILKVYRRNAAKAGKFIYIASAWNAAVNTKSGRKIMIDKLCCPVCSSEFDENEAIKKYLEIHGYDGLWCNEGLDYYCFCALDDLRPCGGSTEECYPGYKIECQCGDGCEFHIGPEQDHAEKEKKIRSHLLKGTVIDE